MNTPERELLADLVERFLDEQLENSPALRALARHLATLTLERLDELESPTQSGAPPSQATTEEREPEAEAQSPPEEPESRPGPTAVVPLRIGDASIQVPVTGETHAISAAMESARTAPRASFDEVDYLERTADARAIDLQQVAARCRLKAEACLHQIVRQSQERDTAEEFESRQRMNDLIATAKSMRDCFLWMFFRKGTPSTDEELDLIARCYTAMAEAADLCHAIEPINEWHDEEEVREALQLLATISSGLRVALSATWLTQPDIDQDEVHQWLKLVTAEHRYHVKRHMQLGDPADPADDVSAARERAKELLGALENQRKNRDKADRLLKRALYHAQRVRDAATSPYEEEPPLHDCKKINDAVEQLRALDAPDLDRMVRQIAAVAPPEYFPDAVQPDPMLRSAAESLAQPQNGSKDRSRRARETAKSERVWSEDVLRVRELLGGGQVVVVGGEPRRDAIERITDAFALDAVVWPDLTEHGSAEPMRAPISNPDTRLVIVLIKLTGHEHAERARDFARQANVPFVLMPAGYNPEQIAAEVMRQASAQLRSA